MFQVILGGRAHGTAEEIHMKTQQGNLSTGVPTKCLAVVLFRTSSNSDGVMLETYSKTNLGTWGPRRDLLGEELCSTLVGRLCSVRQSVASLKRNKIVKRMRFLEGCLAV